MARESDNSVAPPGFAAPTSFVPVAAVPAGDSPSPETPAPGAPSRRLPDLPWRVIAGALLAVVAIIGAYGLLNPATPSDAAAVRGVISTYEHSLQAGDGIKACAQLTPMAQAQMIQAARKLGYSGTCVGAAGLAGTQLRALVSSASPEIQARARALESAGGATVIVSADGTHAFASPYGESISFVRVDGRWLINSEAGHAVKPQPAHVTGAALQFADQADAVCRVPTAKMNVAMAALKRVARSDSARLGSVLAATLHRADTLGTPLYARLGRMQPPAGEAVVYREYLAANQQEVAAIRSAAQLADHGQASAALQALSAQDSTGRLVDTDAAALGFRSCD
jgi:hypothetical protein